MFSVLLPKGQCLSLQTAPSVGTASPSAQLRNSTLEADVFHKVILCPCFPHCIPVTYTERKITSGLQKAEVGTWIRQSASPALGE